MKSTSLEQREDQLAEANAQASEAHAALEFIIGELDAMDASLAALQQSAHETYDRLSKFLEE